MDKAQMTHLKGAVILIGLGIFTFLLLNSRDFGSLLYLFPIFLSFFAIFSLNNIFSKPTLLITGWLTSFFLIWWCLKMFSQMGEWMFILMSSFFLLCIVFSYYLRDLNTYRDKGLKIFSNIVIFTFLLLSILYFDLGMDCMNTSYAEKGVTDFAVNKCKFFGLYSPSGHALFFTRITYLLFILFIWSPLTIFGLFQGFYLMKNK